ncbi:RHS repeat protein [Psychrobacter sp. YGAH215]|uniref:RHS repeat domain-containing protein n=1 Tax=Psychrobacter sp. YGAH215 TaxID=2596826 RepID=UPI00118722A7|nr:RHS repeat domain-containing protein [Psychrobacter sp. YGAH215]TSB23221.1 RHS repeat protein [Psychrobacter sp. YGAH215]
MDTRQGNGGNRERVAQSFTLTYSYDDNGRVKTRTLPSGDVIEYAYNGEDKKKVGILSGIYLKGLWDKPIVTGMNQDQDTSLVQQFNFGNGIANTLQKDKNGRIVLAGNPKVGQTMTPAVKSVQSNLGDFNYAA